MVGDLIAGLIGKVVDRVWPDATQKAQIALELEKMKQAGDFKALDDALERARMQVDVNKVEAASPDRFVAGWRPFIGWTCGAALAWHYVLSGFLVWLLALSGQEAIMPTVDLGDLIVILLGMLGLGAYRTTEKIKGVA
jgi:hypothetical protein